MTDPTLTAGLPSGLLAAGMHCGIKKSGKRDLGLLLAHEARPAAALTTRNRLLGVHVPLLREHLARSRGLVRAVLVNSGNANCATGPEGEADARAVCDRLAAVVGCPTEQVVFLSTGVIGARLPAERILNALPDLVGSADTAGLDPFSRAILTTDTGPKVRVRDEDGFRVTGVAKGSGMIHPDMATMFGFLLTDAAAPPDAAAALKRVADRSFHRMSVDGDTSPNDTLLMLCGDRPADTSAVERAATDVAADLSRAIASDGEGATRLITVRVTGAASEIEAAEVGRTIASSPLVKTAVTGRDPNWGRILSAASRAGVPVDASALGIAVGGADLFSGGRPHPENEPAAHAHMRDEDEVLIEVDLARGAETADVWTCDLTADYVRINADYRT